MKLVKQGSLGASLCDADVKLSVPGAFRMVEDLVTEMMGELHIDGVTCMREYGAMWVFVRNHMELKKDLYWREKYSAECYISSFSLLKLYIDTVLKNAAGEIILFSRLELCAVDLRTMKIRKCETVGVGPDTPPETPECDCAFSRERYARETLLETLKVRSSDIDYCHHTNNISYVQYLVNQQSVGFMLKHPVRMMEVQYAGQTHEGDTLTVWSCGKAVSCEGAELYTIMQGEKPAVNFIVLQQDEEKNQPE